MPKLSRPRKGSLQFSPRKRAAKLLPSANWKPISSKKEGLLGFIAYKVGMASASVKDTTEKSMTANKNIIMPITILEAPEMKIFSVRFYKSGQVAKDIIVSTDKELKKKLKVPKSPGNLDNAPEFDDIRVIAYSLPSKIKLKKTPDLIELAIQSDNKLEYVKSLVGKEISISDFLDAEEKLVDVRGVTKGKGTQGPVKRFGIDLKFHKSEKGRRTPGSIAPWHPARITFRAPMPGQLGLFSRIEYNKQVLSVSDTKEKDLNPAQGFNGYGKVTGSYIILSGSIPGPSKRQILISKTLRPSKDQSKKKLELMEVFAK